MSENGLMDLKKYMIKLIEHLGNENIVTGVSANDLGSKTFDELVILLRDTLKEEYPKTKLKRIMKSVHYANGFSDSDLKQSAFILDEIEQYLCINKFLNHDKSVKYFNKRIVSNEFEINPQNMVLLMIESLLCSKGKYKIIRI
ncbi:hypothetical protein EHW90_02895 [Lachnoanaerobaculum orale]|uniref:Uncharacterized protein n=1 Tax=Lachnoanaerobaculum orale TaxID=979627 RepID=A0A3P3Q4D4_9FIRM|nr:hypothetical protein [Lachnoanaerobaculum orale]EHO51406.1 hypothetical protein HMPREF9099_02024 [Lachnospiraceae bacterium oral taxon 082 str. F0431]RRJ15995.1 hypothetical protein EHW90_02895 [Lachnoanaerobaculum orale]